MNPKVFSIAYQVEGLTPDGKWVAIDRTLGIEQAPGDHQAHRDHVIKVLRENGVSRYTNVRLAKYVTTAEIIGESIPV